MPSSTTSSSELSSRKSFFPICVKIFGSHSWYIRSYTTAGAHNHSERGFHDRLLPQQHINLKTALDHEPSAIDGTEPEVTTVTCELEHHSLMHKPTLILRLRSAPPHDGDRRYGVKSEAVLVARNGYGMTVFRIESGSGNFLVKEVMADGEEGPWQFCLFQPENYLVGDILMKWWDKGELEKLEGALKVAYKRYVKRPRRGTVLPGVNICGR